MEREAIPMTMQSWDGEYRAPTGLFRVIGSDDFPQPPEEFWIGDFAELIDASKAAYQSGSMTNAVVYSDHGKPIEIVRA